MGETRMVILWFVGYFVIGIVSACIARRVCKNIDFASLDDGQFISFIVFWPFGLFIFIIILLVELSKWIGKS